MRGSMLRIVTAALLFCFSVAAYAAEPVARLPYRIDYGGWFTVSGTVNGQGPYDFIIDTGSSHSFVFENLAALQTFPPSGGPPQTVLGLSSSGAHPTYKIGDIALGPVVLKDAATVILADWSVEERSPQGVVGLDILRHYRLVFNAESRELFLYAKDEALDPAYAAWKEAPLETAEFDRDAGELFTITARLNRSPTRFLLDLGAAGTVINRAAYRRATDNQLAVRIAPLTSTTPIGRVTDALDTTVKAQTARITRVRAGAMTWGGVLMIVHDAQIFADLNLSEEPFGLFGADMLRDRSFALDFPGRRLLVGPKARNNS